MFRKIILFLFPAILFLACSSYAQRYNFEHYDIEDGLTQSQITGITQDPQRRLWISTLGGVSCFNGKYFCNYGKSDGLSGNYCTDILSLYGNLLIGTSEGLSSYNYRKFSTVKNTEKGEIKLLKLSSGLTYGLQSGILYRILKGAVYPIPVTGSKKEFITSIAEAADGNVMAAVSGQGIFDLKDHRWRPNPINHKLKDLMIRSMMADDKKTIVLTNKGIYELDATKIKPIYTMIDDMPTAMAKDNKGNYWIGTLHGAWLITSSAATKFNAQNGLTNSEVMAIYSDVEGNVWLGTNGDGLYKYGGSGYVTFDDSQGLKSKIVMTFTEGFNSSEVLIGTTNGLYKYSRNTIKEINLPSNTESSHNITFLSRQGPYIWIGTAYGVFIYDGKDVKSVAHISRGVPFNGIAVDAAHMLWLSSSWGLFCYNQNSGRFAIANKNIRGITLKLDDNNFLSGGPSGVYLFKPDQMINGVSPKKLFDFSILSMLKLDSNVLFGTSDYGIYIWNRKTGSLKNLGTKDGLPSNHIYSMLADSKGIIWLGTGKGIIKLKASDFSLDKNTGSSTLLAESNQNAILETNEGVWVGTTKGAVLYSKEEAEKQQVKPSIYISSISAPGSSKQNNITTLSHHQNKITINYIGIYLKHPTQVRYSYRLMGLDSAWSPPVNDGSMTFTAIPSGRYNFQVKAVTTTGLVSENVASYPFEISTTYYQRAWFKILALLLIACIIILSVYTMFTLGERRRKLRLKIKLEEQAILRKQTAEDFHDDLGNKLTRITVLSEVLKSMIGDSQPEKLNLLSKIGNNVDELYNSTRDILWSLNPKNDKLSQLLDHIRAFGTEMFNNTPISFSSEIDLHGIDTRLSLDMSRNILMILKESINNVLKHSDAEKVFFSALLNNEFLLLTLEDNGSGFDTEVARNGHGVNNMYVRAKRIHADLSLQSSSAGTAICLMINFSTLKQKKNV